MEITLAHLDDLADVAALFDAYRVFYEQPTDLEAATHFIRERMTQAQSTILLARRDGAPAGFTQLYPSYTSVGLARIWILNDLFVARDHRRHGVARALMDAAAEHARRAGAVRLVLETARDNTPAQHLYESLGYHVADGILVYELDLA